MINNIIISIIITCSYDMPPKLYAIRDDDDEYLYLDVKYTKDDPNKNISNTYSIHPKLISRQSKRRLPKIRNFKQIDKTI